MASRKDDFSSLPKKWIFFRIPSSEAATGGALNNFANLTGKRLYWSLFLIKLQASGLQIY